MNVRHCKTKTIKYTLKEFTKDYPNDKVCLDKLFQLRYGKLEACPCCGVVNPSYKRIPTRRCYQCKDCKNQLYPTAGTIFEKTRTPLVYWFYAIFLFTVTRNGVAAAELQRQLGVTYKTAFRMGHKIRELMRDKSFKIFEGKVEIDEVYIGGEFKNKHNSKKSKKWDGFSSKTPVFGLVERGGKVMAKVIERANKENILSEVKANVKSKSIIITDGLGAYIDLYRNYIHVSLNRSKGEYVRGEYHTNTIEGFWSQLKRMIKGTHIQVSRKYLQNYVNEATFRYNNSRQPMFEVLFNRIG